MCSVWEGQAGTEERVKELAQAQARTEQRVEELAHTEARFERTFEEQGIELGIGISAI